MKIYVSVGTQLSFERLVSTVDDWAATRTDMDVFAQIGPSKLRPRHIQFQPFLPADECQRRVREADVVVAHAGMGSILTALELGKPLLIMPRLSALNEHRNDHQVGTAKRLGELGRAVVVYDEAALVEQLNNVHLLRQSPPIASQASDELIGALRLFVDVGLSDRRPGMSLPSRLQSLVESLTSKIENTTDRDFKKKIAARTGGMDTTIPLPERNPNRPSASGRSAAKAAGIRPREGTTLLSRTRAVVLMIGPLANRTLESDTGRCILDLPLRKEFSLMDSWCRHFRELAPDLSSHARLRGILNNAGAMPPIKKRDEADGISFERDPRQLRGTGGVLRDIASEYEDDDYLLVVPGAHFLTQPLRHIAFQLARTGGDVNLLAHHDGSPGGIMLIRCLATRNIPKTGYVDFKEQSLPNISKNFRVRICRQKTMAAMPVRTPRDYINAVQQCAILESGGRIDSDVFSERWNPGVSVIEEGAWVSSRAHVHNSVVLSGARLEANSLVARSVVCCAAIVRPRAVVTDRVVSAGFSN